MEGICPNIKHPDWIEAVSAFGKDQTLFIYDWLGGRIPSKSETKLLLEGETLTPQHNQRVWDVNKAEGFIEGWQTVEGKRKPTIKTFLGKTADNKIMELRKKYYKDKIGFSRGIGEQIDNRWYYPIEITDKRFVTEGLAELHVTRNFQRADIEADFAAMEAETQSSPWKKSIPSIEEIFPNTKVKKVVYHGTDKPLLLEDRALYFTDDFDYALNAYAIPSVSTKLNPKDFSSKEEYKKALLREAKVISAYINIESIDEIIEGYAAQNKVGVENYGIKTKDESASVNIYAVFTPEQVYVIDEQKGKDNESRKLTGIQTEPETRTGLKEKLAILQKAIPQVEFVISDQTLSTIAMVEAGGKTIRINPDMMTTDSIGHEYGHVLIDILGGMSNPLIKQGREQLKGTEIERAVMAAYPDLATNKDDRLDKEILTTAVGLKAAELFKDLEQQNKWLRWLIRFFRRIRAMLGIESSVVLKLAERLVSGTPVKTREYATSEDKEAGFYIKGKPSLYEQYSRTLGDTMTLIDKMIVKEEEIQDKAALALQKKLDVYAKKGKETAEYKSLEEALPRIQGTNPTKSLIHMLRFAVESTKQMNDEYVAYLKQDRYPTDDNKKRTLNVKLLAEWRTSVASWDMLEDLRTLYTSTNKQIEAFGTEEDKKALKQLFFENRKLLEAILGEKEFAKVAKATGNNIIDILVPLLDKAIEVKNEVQVIYKEKGKELIVDFLFPYVNHVKVFKREQYEREWLEFDESKQKETPKATYITQRLIEETPQIEVETRNLILQELGKAEGDVGFLTRYIDTILDSRDIISSALARAVYGIQEKSNREIVNWQYKFVDALTPLEKQLRRTSGTPDEKFWDWIIETDPETGRPMHNIISSLPSKLIEDYWKQYEIVYSSTFKDNQGNLYSDEEKAKILHKWKEQHAPRDNEAWIKAQTELADKLYEEGIITEKELKKYISNVKVKYRASKLPLTKIFKDQQAIDIVTSFNYRHEWAFRTPQGYYKDINKKWEALQKMREVGLVNGVQTDERVKFYDFLQNVLDEAAARLPGKYALTTELPSMLKSAGQRYRASGALGMSKADFLKYEFKAKFQKKSTDTDRGDLLDTPDEELNAVGKEKKEQLKKEGGEGVEKTVLVNEAGEPVYFLPIYYTQNKTHDVGKKVPIYDQSFDIASLYFNYLKMAIDFGNKYEMLAELEMTNYFINDRDVIRRDSKGRIYTDAAASKLRKVKENLRDKAITDAGTKSMLAAQVADFLKTNLYGMEHEEEPDMNILGFTVDRAKALDSLTSFTALNLLGMNFIAGLANLNLGEITQLVESFAGQYTTAKDLKDATGYYYKNLGGILMDIGTRRPVNIVSLLNDRFHTLNEEVDGKINLNSRIANMFNTNTLFMTSHAGEHYMQTRFMLAMLKTLKATDDKGNVLGSMLDMFSVDPETNTLKLDERVANFSDEDQTNFSARMHRTLSSMHGEYSKIGQSSIQRHAIGRMGLLFRKFVVPGFKRRWQGGRKTTKPRKGNEEYDPSMDYNKYSGINNLSGEYTEGYYMTFGRLIKQYAIDLFHLKMEMMEANGRTGKYKLTDWERANMIRMAGEMSFLIVSVILANVLVRMKANDDDKDNIALNNLAYQALRLRAELAFYINPMATLQILRSPMASMSVIENVLKLFGQLFYPLYSGTFDFQVYEQGSWKGHLKIEKTINNLIPVEKQWDRILNAGDQLSWFKQ